VVQGCIDQGLLGSEGFAINASFVEANAAKKKTLTVM